MSMYNVLHGVDPYAALWLKSLGLNEIPEGQKMPELPQSSYSEWGEVLDNEDTRKFIADCIDRKIYPLGRFRDIHLSEKGTRIILFTRNGGGNRDTYWYLFEILKNHPNYVRDYDDDFDSTYAHIEFTTPNSIKPVAEMIAKHQGEPKSFLAKHEEVVSEMEKMTKEELENDPRFKTLITKLKSAIEGKEEVVEI